MGKVSPTFIDITLCTCVWQRYSPLDTHFSPVFPDIWGHLLRCAVRMVSFEEISAASQANSATSNHRGADLISDALPFGRLWYGEPNAISNAIDYAKFYSRSHDAVIRVYGEAGNVIETHEHAGDFKEW
jgi:hypothetical protein